MATRVSDKKGGAPQLTFGWEDGLRGPVTSVYEDLRPPSRPQAERQQVTGERYQELLGSSTQVIRGKLRSAISEICNYLPGEALFHHSQSRSEHPTALLKRQFYPSNAAEAPVFIEDGVLKKLFNQLWQQSRGKFGEDWRSSISFLAEARALNKMGGMLQGGNVEGFMTFALREIRSASCFSPLQISRGELERYRESLYRESLDLHRVCGDFLAFACVIKGGGDPRLQMFDAFRGNVKVSKRFRAAMVEIRAEMQAENEKAATKLKAGQKEPLLIADALKPDPIAAFRR
ncbi:MAG: hypothetical protein DCC75_03120 [Proteobacteria bacterium]|nr:MAG: hypothetical protein DCC75_03120 [Pseudomonadota bacterium]